MQLHYTALCTTIHTLVTLHYCRLHKRVSSRSMWGSAAAAAAAAANSTIATATTSTRTGTTPKVRILDYDSPRPVRPQPMLTPRDNSRLSSAFHSVQSSFAGALVTGVASSLAHIPATVMEARAEIQVCMCVYFVEQC
jgi:hypothetical protein